jgi:hypothetical protein
MLITKYKNEAGVVDKVVLTSQNAEDSKKMAEFGEQEPIKAKFVDQPDWFKSLKKIA